jgi:nitrogen fixation/metabolism regulation signal transduction histidine kinase
MILPFRRIIRLWLIMIDASENEESTMRSSFRRKLFRLFLLFALVPAILLALVGYYLAVDTSSLPPAQPDQYAKELTTYYNNLLFQRIDSCLESYLSDSSRFSPLLDFIFLQPNGQVTVTGDTVLPPAVIAKIVSAGKNRPHGFVEFGGHVYQYSYQKLSDTAVLCGGLSHDSAYSRLLASFQSGYASRKWAEELRPRYLFFLTVVFVVLALATAGIAYFFSARFSKNLTRPLLELSEASKEIAAGNFQQTVSSSGTGEIQTLITNFNRMAQQLDRATTRLAQSERVAAWRHVARQFAHELKNPLQPILISLYRIEKSLEERADSAQIKEALQAASYEIKHLTELADRFSQLAKLPPPKLEKVDLNELLTSMATLYKEQLAAYDFALRLPSEKSYVKADETYFREGLHNLLQNAIDASEEGGKIIVELKRHRDSVDIVVQDFGKGMTDDVIASARMPYFTTKEKGSGLGLTIVEKTVTEMGGQLLINSREEQGTTVTMSLPRRE